MTSFVNVLPNLFFSFLPILFFIAILIFYIRKSIQHDKERENIELFNTVSFKQTYKKKVNKSEHEQLHPLIESSKGRISSHFKAEEVEINPILQDNLLFLDEITFLPKDLGVFVAKHVHEKILWIDTPFYQIKKWKKMKYLFNLLLFSFIFNLLFLFISYFIVQEENSL